MAQSGALRTFGWAAVLGELMAVLTVLLVLPTALPDRDPPVVQTNDRAKADEPRRRVTAERPTAGVGP